MEKLNTTEAGAINLHNLLIEEIDEHINALMNYNIDLYHVREIYNHAIMRISQIELWYGRYNLINFASMQVLLMKNKELLNMTQVCINVLEKNYK